MIVESRATTVLGTAAALAVIVTACATSAYQPLVVRLPSGLPDDAFDRVETCLQRLYGSLPVADVANFRFRSGWVPHRRGDLPGELRATVFGESSSTLGVVVEVRYLVLSITGMPYWTEVRGDAEQEAELGDMLAEVLQ